MIVYAVMDYGADERELEAIFSSRELADKYIELIKEHCISFYHFSPPEVETRYAVEKFELDKPDAWDAKLAQKLKEHFNGQ